MSVDGTDFPLAWGANQKRLSCYKFYEKPGLQYEVGVCLRTSDIVWISGSHFPGLYNDLQIFRMGMKDMLEDGERVVEADDGYIGENPLKYKCTNGVNKDPERAFSDQQQCSRHEQFNERF